MKRSHIVPLCFFGLSGCVSHPVAEIQETRMMESVFGSAIGYGGEEGQFSRLFRKLVRSAPDSEIRSMISDPRPPVRVMGFVVGLHRWPSERSALVESALRDTAEVAFVWGCDIMGQKVSVARLVAEEASLIDAAVTPLRRKEPNQAPATVFKKQG